MNGFYVSRRWYMDETPKEYLIGAFICEWSQLEMMIHAVYTAKILELGLPENVWVKPKMYSSMKIEKLKGLISNGSLEVAEPAWNWLVEEFDRLNELRNDVAHGLWAEGMFNGDLAAMRPDTAGGVVWKFEDAQTLRDATLDVSTLSARFLSSGIIRVAATSGKLA
jgi:hypothetical protein